MTRGRGRPPGREEGISPAKILSEALTILDSEGLDALTMRALALRAGVNPMTIHYHFTDRDGLIKALAEQVYADVATPAEGSVRAQVEGLLMAYRMKVVAHPSLTLAIFNRPAVFPDHAKRITDSLGALLQGLGLPPGRALLWVHILVDYTHGAALATAMDAESGAMPPAANEEANATYARAVSELLDRIGDQTG